MLGLLATLFVAVAHFGFFALETLLWTTPRARRIFGNTVERAENTKLLAANQGVYNAALAAGLVWAVAAGHAFTTVVLLSFVIAVGVYGGVTVKRSILVVQALPAALALAFVHLGL
jgi:putative membrane protein